MPNPSPRPLASYLPPHLRDQMTRPMVEVHKAWANRSQTTSIEDTAMNYLVANGVLGQWRPEHETESFGPGPGLAQIEAHNAAVAAGIAANAPTPATAPPITTPAAPPPAPPPLAGLPPAQPTPPANGAAMNAADWRNHLASLGLRVP